MPKKGLELSNSGKYFISKVAVGIFSPIGILSPGVGQGLNMLRICSGEKSNLDKDALGERDGRPARGDQERLRRET